MKTGGKLLILIVLGCLFLGQGCFTINSKVNGTKLKENSTYSTIACLSVDCAVGYSLAYDKGREPRDNMINGIGSSCVVFILDIIFTGFFHFDPIHGTLWE
jgi:hypothetical protein